MNRLEAIGWSPFFAEAYESRNAAGDLWPARVSQEQRGGYRVLWAHGELRAAVWIDLRHRKHDCHLYRH